MPTRHRCGKPQCPRCPQTPRVRQLEPVPRKKPLKSFTEPLVVLCLLRYFFEILPQFHFYPPISVHCRVFLPDPSLFPVPPFPAPCPRSSPSAHPPRFLLRFLPPSPSPSSQRCLARGRGCLSGSRSSPRALKWQFHPTRQDTLPPTRPAPVRGVRRCQGGLGVARDKAAPDCQGGKVTHEADVSQRPLLHPDFFINK